MNRKLAKLSIAAAVVGSFCLVGASAVAQSKMGRISGRVNTQYMMKQSTVTKDATMKRTAGIFTDARLGWSSTFRDEIWKGGAKVEIDIQEYGAGIRKTSQSSGFLVTHRDKYVYLQNDLLKFLMGYAWDHLNGGVQGGKYFNYLLASTQNSVQFRGVHASRVEGLAISLRSFDDMDFKLVLNQGSDGKANWQKVSGSKKTNDTGVGFTFKMRHDLFNLSTTLYQATSKGDKDRDPNSADYELTTSMISIGFQWFDLIRDAHPFFNYQVKTARNESAKTGDGFVRVEIGVDYALDEVSGITAVFNTKTEDREDPDTNGTDETLAVSYMTRIANVRLGAGFSRETHVTNTDSWNKENRLGANMIYYF